MCISRSYEIVHKLCHAKWGKRGFRNSWRERLLSTYNIEWLPFLREEIVVCSIVFVAFTTGIHFKAGDWKLLSWEHFVVDSSVTSRRNVAIIIDASTDYKIVIVLKKRHYINVPTSDTKLIDQFAPHENHNLFASTC